VSSSSATPNKETNRNQKKPNKLYFKNPKPDVAEVDCMRRKKGLTKRPGEYWSREGHD